MFYSYESFIVGLYFFLAVLFMFIGLSGYLRWNIQEEKAKKLQKKRKKRIKKCKYYEKNFIRIMAGGLSLGLLGLLPLVIDLVLGR